MTRASASKHADVSVVIPTRNRPTMVLRAVESVLAQTYRGAIEVVVVFDQTEPVPLPVETRPERQIRILVNDRSPGLAGARNTGILAARGDLVAYCDDDDEWFPEKLARQEEAQQRLGASAVGSGIVVCYRGREVPRRPPRTAVVSFDDLLRSRRMELHPSTILVKRAALLDSIGLVDEQIPGGYAEDYEWLLRASRAAVLGVVKEPLVRVYWHDSSFFAGRWETIISALIYLVERYPEFSSEPVGLARIYGQIAFAHAALGHSDEARRWASRCLRLDALQPRAYLAALVSTGLVRAPNVVRTAHRFGRGI